MTEREYKIVSSVCPGRDLQTATQQSADQNLQGRRLSALNARLHAAPNKSQQDESTTQNEYFSGSVIQQPQIMNKVIAKRNGIDLKKTNGSMLGYLAGVSAIGSSLQRPMISGVALNDPVKSASATLNN